MFHVDDLTCAAWGEAVMQRYLLVIEEFCGWMGIAVKVKKTEVSGYDY